MAVHSDFILSIRDLMGKPGSMRQLEFFVTAPEKWGEAVAQIPEGADVEVSGQLESVHEGILASGEIHAPAQAQCVRCLDPVGLDIATDFTELFAYSDGDGYDNRVVEETIDLGVVVRDQVILQLPFQPMCSPDCPGLNPETGEKRPDGWQEDTENRLDPRWEALRKLIEQDPTTGENGTSRE